MPKDSIRKLREEPSFEDKMNALSKVKPSGLKFGDNLDRYFYVDEEQLRMKSGEVGAIMSRSGSIIQPGEFINIQTPFQRVEFNKMAFHPLSDQPSTAASPHPTLVQSLLDSDLELFKGVFSILKSLAGGL